MNLNLKKIQQLEIQQIYGNRLKIYRDFMIYF